MKEKDSYERNSPFAAIRFLSLLPLFIPSSFCRMFVLSRISHTGWLALAKKQTGRRSAPLVGGTPEAPRHFRTMYIQPYMQL